MKYILKLFVKFYKKCISPYKPSCCIYYPKCSDYALEALQIHGAFKGTCLTIRRILRCNPFRKGGVDPVPPKIKIKGSKRKASFKS